MLNIPTASKRCWASRLIRLSQLPPLFAPGNTVYDSRHHDHITVLNQRETIVNRVAIEVPSPGFLKGLGIQFRDKNDINTLSKPVESVTGYADNLRIMRHEQLNWTATLVGLLQMQRYDDALRYIQVQAEGAQQVLDFLHAVCLSCPVRPAVLGKYVSARRRA